MSATGRGAERQEFDWYPTPKWVVHRLLESEEVKLPGGTWLEPCAGEGSIIRAVNERRKVHWTAVELQPCFKNVLFDSGVTDVCIDNFLTWDPGVRFDVAISNPPYALAQEVIQHCFEFADTVVMFLRINFLGSDKRGDWIYEYVPDVHVLPNRPSLNVNKEGKKGTDATEYAWFVWPSEVRTTGKLSILGRTSLEERAVGWEETLRILGGMKP